MQGGRRVSGHWEKVRAGQAGRRIVDEAREMRARAIVMPLPRAAAGGARCSARRSRRCSPSARAASIIESAPRAAEPAGAALA